MKPVQGHFQSSTPVLLTSPCTVAQRGIGVPQSTQLSYPYRRAIWIEEIRVDLALPEVTGINLGAIVYAKFQLGRHYLMRDPVPVYSLGTFMDFNQEQAPGSATSYSHYRWRLPEPLFIEAGQYLTAELYRYADGFNSVNGQVSYVGRTVPQNYIRPDTLAVPYAAPFVTPLNPPGGYVQSNEYHLLNPFDKPVRIQRLTGRFVNYLPGTSCGLGYDLTPPFGGGVDSLTTVKVYDSWGGKVVNDFTGTSDVWDIAREAWTVDTVMPGKGMYEVQVWNLAVNTQVAVAMIGTREEQR